MYVGIYTPNQTHYIQLVTLLLVKGKIWFDLRIEMHMLAIVKIHGSNSHSDTIFRNIYNLYTITAKGYCFDIFKKCTVAVVKHNLYLIINWILWSSSHFLMVFLSHSVSSLKLWWTICYAGLRLQCLFSPGHRDATVPILKVLSCSHGSKHFWLIWTPIFFPFERKPDLLWSNSWWLETRVNSNL